MTLLSVPTLAEGVAGWATWLGFVGSTAANFVFPSLGVLGLAVFVTLQLAEARARKRDQAGREHPASGAVVKELLGLMHQQGVRLLHRNSGEWETVDPWLGHSAQLVSDALGRGEMLRMIGEALPVRPFTLSGVQPTEQSYLVQKRLVQLQDLMGRIDFMTTEPDFKPDQ